MSYLRKSDSLAVAVLLIVAVGVFILCYETTLEWESIQEYIRLEVSRQIQEQGMPNISGKYVDIEIHGGAVVEGGEK